MKHRNVQYLKVFLCVIIVFCRLNLTAQIKSWNHTHYTTKEGLPCNIVHRVVQDIEGYIWIATESGLCKFDGDEFIWLLHNQKDPASLPADYVYDVALHPDGRLLASTSNGLYVMNTKTHRGFTIHAQITKGWESMDDNFRNIYIHSKLQQIFVLTATAIIIFDYQLKKVKTIAYSFPQATENIGLSITNYSPLFLPNGDVLFADNHKQHWGLMDYQQAKIVPFQPRDNHPYQDIYQSTNLDCFSIDSAENIWFHQVGKDTLFCIKPYQKRIAYPLLGDAAHTGWTGRICFPSARKMTWAYINHASTILYELPYTYLLNHPGCVIEVSKRSGFSATGNSIYEDRTGNWWITSINGLYLVKSDRDAFEKIELPLPFKYESEWQYVSDIKRVDHDNILITTFLEHCYLYNIRTNTIKSYLDTIGDERSDEFAMHMIIPLDSDRLMIYGNQGFMFQNHQLSLNPSLTNEFEKLFEQYALKRFYRDKAGNCWASFEDYGLAFWNPQNKKFIHFPPQGDLCTDQFTSFTEDADGNLWFLNYVQPKLWKFDRQKFRFDSTYIQLPSRWNKRMIAGPKHLLYMVSNDGLIMFDTKSQRSKSITMFDGLPSTSLLGLYAYRQYLFISSKNGLAIMNTHDFSIQIVHQAEGIFEGVTSKSFLEDSKQHQLYIGGKGHVYKMDLNTFFVSKGRPTVVIHQLKVNNQQRDSIQGPITLKPEENNLTFSVSSIDFYSGVNKTYYYRTILNGDTTAWKNNQRNKQFSFLNLAPGEYTVEIKSTNANGEWSSNVASLSFTILKPWYNRWWFYGLVLIVVGSVLYWIFTNRIKQLRRIEQIRSKLSRDLHDDIGSTLSSINILSRTAQMQAQQQGDEKTKSALQKIHERSQRLLVNMSDIIWNVNPGNDNLEEVLSRMREYATTMLESRNIDYHFQFPNEAKTCILEMDTKTNIYLIFKEAINNLCKYSEATRVVMTLQIKDKILLMTIEDNGKGFARSALNHEGGLNNMQFRAEELGGHLSIESSPGTGVQIKLVLPNLC